MGVREWVDQDYVIEHLRQKFNCSVLWCEGRACLEYKSKEELNQMAGYVKDNFSMELLDVFFTAVESLDEEVKS
ncbi:hypothetical protein KB559_13305 [Paenibacillus sp. Marseille-P2973]|uniref:hypothetical protein n=1 Tax=Paenibacillus sp. Marseille-P2973 TaxID=1871032 RepID=UPI001B35EC0D|nr:hypothetical protein [Paenibacillus sp. Marseille-P2973]MBQ4899822.1 hypothetical protein [Paenibacillus sp. Marseille-P2973]